MLLVGREPTLTVSVHGIQLVCYPRSSYLTDSGVIAGEFVRPGIVFLSSTQAFPSYKGDQHINTLDEVTIPAWLIGS